MQRKQMLVDDLRSLADSLERGELPKLERTGQWARVYRLLNKLGLHRRAVQRSWGIEQQREYMQQVGRKGGKARAKALSDKERREIGKRAARARWAKGKKGGTV